MFTMQNAATVLCAEINSEIRSANRDLAFTNGESLTKCRIAIQNVRLKTITKSADKFSFYVEQCIMVLPATIINQKLL